MNMNTLLLPTTVIGMSMITMILLLLYFLIDNKDNILLRLGLGGDDE